MLAILAHLVLAPVAAILAAVALAVSALSRWHPLWLTVPAGAGAIATAQVGIGPAAAGFAAGPCQVITVLAGTLAHPSRLAHLPVALAGTAHLLPAQLPLALLIAPAEAALTGWLAGRSAPADQPEARYRPGLIVVIRRWLAWVALAAGETVTREGFALGLIPESGWAAEVTWARAEGGVLIAAATPATATLAAFPAAAAAIRRRKAVIVVDLLGSGDLARALAAACEEAGAPLTQIPAAAPAGLVHEMEAAIFGRGVLLLSAGSGRATADLATVLRGLGRERLRADCLAWVHGCGTSDAGGHGDLTLADLPALGAESGTAVLLSAGNPAAAAELAPAARVVVASGPLDQELSRRLAGLAPFGKKTGQQAVADLLRWQDEDELAVIERGPAGRLLTGCRQVPAPGAWRL